MDWANCKMRRETLKFWDLVHHIYIRGLMVYIYISWSWLAKGFGNQWSGQLLRYHPMSWIPTCCLLNNGLRVYTRVLHNGSFRGSHHGHNGWIGTIMTLISLANWSLMCVTLRTSKLHIPDYIDGLVQERCNSSALAMELHLSCTNPSICAKKLSVYNGCLWTVIPLTSLAKQLCSHLVFAWNKEPWNFTSLIICAENQVIKWFLRTYGQWCEFLCSKVADRDGFSAHMDSDVKLCAKKSVTRPGRGGFYTVRYVKLWCILCYVF